MEHTLCGRIRSLRTHSWTHVTDLNTEIPPVDVAPQEEILRNGGVAAELEEFHEVVLVAGRFRMCARIGAQGGG